MSNAQPQQSFAAQVRDIIVKTFKIGEDDPIEIRRSKGGWIAKVLGEDRTTEVRYEEGKLSMTAG
jgi:hypothetical protein